MNPGLRDLIYSGAAVVIGIILNLLAWTCWYNLPATLGSWIGSTLWLLAIGCITMSIVFLARP